MTGVTVLLLLLPQDVLGHPNTKAVVSHCGLHSVNEAAYHGVPLVGIPFQMEQVGISLSYFILLHETQNITTSTFLVAACACSATY
jgi:hypothetical protein